jgi:hypothetical protein
MLVSWLALKRVFGQTHNSTNGVGLKGGTAQYRRLPVPEGDAPLRQIVGRQFERDFISGKHADSIAPQSARQVRQHDPLMFELDTEKSTWELF